MNDKLTEIRERHTTKPLLGSNGTWADEWSVAHKDRGYLLGRITELESDNTRLREQVDSYAHQLHTLQDACKGG